MRAENQFLLVRQNDVETVAVIPSLRLVSAAVELLEWLCAGRVLRADMGGTCGDQEREGESIRSDTPESLFAPRRSLSDCLPVPPFDYWFGAEKSLLSVCLRTTWPL